jgi:hypothetical protein
VFRKFFTDYAEVFEGAPLSVASGEHNIEYYELFQKYLLVYEVNKLNKLIFYFYQFILFVIFWIKDTLEKYLTTLDCSIEDFYKEVRIAQDETHDQYLQTFIDCLLASTDYDSFYKVMAREGSKSKIKKMSLPSKAESKFESKNDVGSKYESKGSKK